MADWTTISSLATASGTLVLAAATFASVRSANRAARVAEHSMLAGLRPLLLGSRRDDPAEKVTWMDEHFTVVPGGQATVEREGDVVYLAASLRNVGAGLALLHAWQLVADRFRDATALDDFRRLSRDLYIAPNDTGFWQGALRDADDPDAAWLRDAVSTRQRFAIDILYGDQEGGQRTITRFQFVPVGESAWLFSPARHWQVDRAEPR